jgi:hypothetical protein
VKFKLEIRMDNSAFDEGNQAQELARILRELAEDADAFDVPATVTLRDANGNTVGAAKSTKYA